MTKTKRIFATILTITTIVWSMGPSLAYALAITDVKVSTSSIEITFDDDVLSTTLTVAEEWGDPTNSAGDLRNYQLKVGDPLVTRFLTREAPFSMSTEYYAAEHKMRIYGIEDLYLNTGDDWEFSILYTSSTDPDITTSPNAIRHVTSTDVYVDAYTNTGTVLGIGAGGLQDPFINYISNSSESPSPDGCHLYPCGAIGSTIEIHGSNFTSTTKANYHFADTGTLVSTTFVSAEKLTAVIPTGVGPGEVIVQVQDQETGRFSNDRKIVVWDSTIGVIYGYLTLADGTTGVDDANIRVDLPYYWGSGGDSFTHSNGKFAVAVTSAGTYEGKFHTPPSITESAPGRVDNISVTLGQVTNMGGFSTKNATISGKVCAPDSDPCDGVEGVQVRVHTYDWRIEQMAMTKPDGSWSVYIDNTGSFVNLGIETEPSDYHKNSLGYMASPQGQYDQTLWTDDTVVGLEIYLTTANVTGTIKTPVTADADTNPTALADTVVPDASIGLRTEDWSYEQWTHTDSSGNFKFGGAPAGTGYVLEIEPPWSGDYAIYPRTTITGLTINPQGTTNLGVQRFSSPNVWGVVKAGGSAVANAWVMLHSPGAWYGTDTDANGKFKFGGVSIGWYELEVEPPYGSTYSRYRAEVEITSTTTNNLGDITLSAPNVTGFLYGPTGTAAQKAWIDVCPYEGPGNCYGDGTCLDTGAFGISIPNGTWRLEVHPSWEAIYAQPAPMTLVVADGLLSTVDGSAPADPWIIRMADASEGGLTGMVCAPGDTDACENPQGNVGLNLRSQGYMSEFRWSQTNDSGNFAFANVDPGTYDLEADPWGSVDYSRKLFTITVNADDTVTIGSNTYIDRDVRLFLSSPNITGYIYTPAFAAGHTSTSNPTPNTAVQWSWINMHQEGPMMGPGGWYGTDSNDAGYFKFGGVAPGSNYVLEVEGQWGSAYTRNRYRDITFTDSDGDGTADECNTSTIENDGNASDAQCDLGKLLGTDTGDVDAQSNAIYAVRVGIPNLRGQIVKPDGTTGVRDAWVMVHDQHWMNEAGGNTNQNGYFSLGGLPNGNYFIEINMPWGGESSYTAPSGLTVTIADDIATIKQNNVALANNKITLTTPEKYLTGFVYKDTNDNNEYDLGVDTVVTNARVEAHRDMGGGFFETRVNSSGEYTLNLSGGSYWVEVWPDWGLGQPDWVYAQPPNRITFPSTSDKECKGTTARCTAADATATDIGDGLDFKVESANSTITGYVKTPTGTAVSNAWVDAHKGMGPGNGANTDNNGRFSISVPAGTYEIMVMPSTSDYGSPNPTIVKVADGATTDVGEIFLKARNAHITGTVTDSAGNAIGNVMINTWQFDAPGWAMAFTNSTTGRYDLTLGAGTWNVMLMPMSGDYVYQGAPLTVTVDDNETSDNNDFVLKNADTTLKVNVIDTDGNRVSDFWGGVWVRDLSVDDMMDLGGAMDDMMMKGGLMDEGGDMIQAEGGGMGMGGGGMGPGMEQGGFQGGGLVNGYTEIKVPGGSEASPAQYELGLHAPPGSNYTFQMTKTVDVVSGTDQEVDLVVKANDSIISGHLYIDDNSNGYYDTGEEESGIRAFINAHRAEGGWQMTESEADGSYSLSVASGVWHLDAWIDVFMTFGASKYMIINQDVETIVGSTSTATRDFELKALDATISGTVTDPDGALMDNVWVFVDYATNEMVDDFKGPGGPGVGANTDIDGEYSLNVAGGTYKVGAGIPPWDERDLVNPDLITVTVAAGGASVNNDIQFKESDATITGNITYEGDNKSGFVHAWSEAGGGTGTISFDGEYTLKVTADDIWYVRAESVIGSVFYESDEAVVTTVAGANAQDLVLESREITIPEPKTSSFGADTSKSIILEDGLEIEMPAGSVKSEGTVTVTVKPITIENTTAVQTTPDSTDKLVGITYDFVAKDADGNEITTFVNDIQITLPYTEAVVTQAGYDESALTPKYYDDTTGTWEPFKAVVQDTDNNTFTITTDHFTPGGLTGGRVTGTTVTPTTTTTTTTTTAPGGGAGAYGILPSGPTNVSAWINWGAENTVSRTVTVSLNATNASEMLISNSADFAGATWQTYKTSTYWTLSSGDGEKLVYVKFRDDSYNESSIISDAIVLAEVAPVAAIEKDLVKTADSGAVYLILNNKRHVFPHVAVYQSWAYADDFSTVKTISSADLATFPQGDPVPFRDGSMFRGTAASLHGHAAAAVFYVEDSKLRPVQSGEIYQALFNDPGWNLVTWVPDDLLSKFEYALGSAIASADIHPNGSLVKYADTAGVYLIENGKKRAFNSWSALVANGYGNTKIFTIPATETYEDATVIGGLAEVLITPVIAAGFRIR